MRGVGVGEVVEVVDAGGAKLGEKLWQICMRELADVDSRLESVGDGGAQDADGLLCGESTALAEDVDKFGELALCCAGDHFLANRADVFVGIFAKFRRNHMRSEQCGNDGSLPLLSGGVNGFERFEFAS